MRAARGRSTRCSCSRRRPRAGRWSTQNEPHHLAVRTRRSTLNGRLRGPDHRTITFSRIRVSARASVAWLQNSALVLMGTPAPTMGRVGTYLSLNAVLWAGGALLPCSYELPACTRTVSSNHYEDTVPTSLTIGRYSYSSSSVPLCIYRGL